MKPGAHVVAKGWGWRHAGRSAWAVRDLSFTIERGERVLLLGASGAGKTTLLHAVAGVLGGADEGEEAGQLLVDGAHPTRLHGTAGLVMQDPESQVILARLGDDVAFGPENLAIPQEQIWPRVDAALEAVGLDLPLDRSTTALSGGQKQRLAIAGALAMHVELLLLDEPTANLDPAGVHEVRESIGRSLDATTTLIVVEHRVDTWFDLVDRVIVLAAGGGVLADGTPQTVFDEHRLALLDAGVWVPGVPPVAAEIAGRDATSRTPMGEPVITTSALSVGYSSPAQTDLNLRLPRGASTVVTGPNGAGKTALALTLAGLMRRLGGSVDVAEHLRVPSAPRPTDPQSWASRDLLTRIGTVFQEPEHQFVATTVREELAVGLRALRWSGDAINNRVEQLLRSLHLEHLAEVSPYTLSGGEKRRLSVGSVLAAEPEVIVLDEPTFGQDRTTWLDLVHLVRSLLAGGHTVISVTHDLEYVRVLGDNVIRLELRPGPPTPAPPPPATALDRLNPVTRPLLAMVLSVPLLLTLDWLSAGVALGLELVAFWLAGVRPATIGRRLLPLLIAAPIAALSMLLYGRPGGHIWWRWGPITVSTASCWLALAVLLRVLALGTSAVMLFVGIDPTDMADGLAQVTKLPSRLVLSTLAGIRMLDLLLDDWRSIGLARRARGLGDAGRLRRWLSMAFGVLVLAIRRGVQLATAMEARGFGAGPRTWARPSHFRLRDVAALLVGALLMAISLGAAIAAGSFHWILR